MLVIFFISFLWMLLLLLMFIVAFACLHSAWFSTRNYIFVRWNYITSSVRDFFRALVLLTLNWFIRFMKSSIFQRTWILSWQWKWHSRIFEFSVQWILKSIWIHWLNHFVRVTITIWCIWLQSWTFFFCWNHEITAIENMAGSYLLHILLYRGIEISPISCSWLWRVERRHFS